MDLGLDRRNITKWADDLRNNRFKLKPDEQLRFQMYGNNSFRGFSDTRRRTAQEQMAEYLEFYESFEDALDGELSPEQESEYVQSIVIFKVRRDGSGHWPYPPSRAMEYPENVEAKERMAKRASERRTARIGRMTDTEYDRYLSERAAEKREARAAMSEKQKEEYRRKAKERAAKSRKARKPE